MLARRRGVRVARASVSRLTLLAGLALLGPGTLLGQGMIGRGVTAMPKPKPSGRSFPVSFVDVAASAGLKAPQICGAERKKYIVESMGLGVAFLDFDNDGWPDIFLVNGSRFDDSGETRTLTNHLYRNNRDGTFTDVTQQAGLVHSGWGQSVAVADYDNDGFADLYVTYWGRNVHGEFRRISASDWRLRGSPPRVFRQAPSDATGLRKSPMP